MAGGDARDARQPRTWPDVRGVGGPERGILDDDVRTQQHGHQRSAAERDRRGQRGVGRHGRRLPDEHLRAKQLLRGRDGEMSEIPVPAPVTQLRERRQRTTALTAVGADVLAGVAVAGWAVLLAVLTYRTWGD